MWGQRGKYLVVKKGFLLSHDVARQVKPTGAPQHHPLVQGRFSGRGDNHTPRPRHGEWTCQVAPKGGLCCHGEWTCQVVPKGGLCCHGEWTCQVAPKGGLCCHGEWTCQVAPKGGLCCPWSQTSSIPAYALPIIMGPTVYQFNQQPQGNGGMMHGLHGI